MILQAVSQKQYFWLSCWGHYPHTSLFITPSIVAQAVSISFPQSWALKPSWALELCLSWALSQHWEEHSDCHSALTCLSRVHATV
jgi:hypothetical protein